MRGSTQPYPWARLGWFGSEYRQSRSKELVGISWSCGRESSTPACAFGRRVPLKGTDWYFWSTVALALLFRWLELSGAIVWGVIGSRWRWTWYHTTIPLALSLSRARSFVCVFRFRKHLPIPVQNLGPAFHPPLDVTEYPSGLTSPQ